VLGRDFYGEEGGLTNVSPHDPRTANDIGYIALALAAISCAAAFRGIPVLMWIAVYVFSAFAASAIWKGKSNLSPLAWFCGAAFFTLLTALLYGIGVRVFGAANQPWRIFKLYLILLPALALVFVSGFSRALYIWFSRYRADQREMENGHNPQNPGAPR
jgi:hypothetical protein